MLSSADVGSIPTNEKPGVLRDLAAVLRLGLTFRLDPRPVGRDKSVALLVVAALVAWVGLEWLHLDGPPRFDATGLPGLFAVFASALALASIPGRIDRRAPPARQTLLLVAGYLPAAAAGGWLLTAPLRQWTLLICATLLALHAALYFYFGLRALGAARPWRSVAVLAACIVALVTIGRASALNARVIVVRESPQSLAARQESARRTEELLYAQPARIERAVAAITAGPATAGRMFFIGFAGYGGQRVFADEIAFATQRVHERYGTAGRRVLLINDQRDFDSHPMASPSALARAIEGVAKHMGADDVLFLALSSHGKRTPHLVVENGSLPFDALTGEALAGILRRSGVRWKVLVISACYSGAFIDHLRDDDTVIITASAPDKASFGCNDRRDLTYFGEAFYRDALPTAVNLRAAFENAAAAIARREAGEGLEPSGPLAHFGVAVEKKLGEIEAARGQ